MPRGRQSSVNSPEAIQRELETLKQRHAELRAQLRKSRVGSTEVKKLEAKLEKQLAAAKWTVGLIKQVQSDWDDLGFYQTVRAKQPTPRGRRPRTSASNA